jgi:uncharacterized protein (TIGR04255 family)
LIPVKISFLKPPINEVVIGKAFEPLQGFLVPYFGRFWDLIQDEFPKCEHAPPVVDPAGEPPTDPATGILLPRVWFSSEEPTRLLQLQVDRFYLNWRQTNEKEEYVRFDKVYEDYQRFSTLFGVFAAGQLAAEMIPRRYEMTYVNVFRKGVEWNDFQDISKVVRGFDFLHDTGVLAAISQGQVRLEYVMRDCPGRLAVTLALAKNTITQEPALRFELAAAVRVKDHEGLEEKTWHLLAHDAIVNAFCELTTEHAQKSFWHLDEAQQ